MRRLANHAALDDPGAKGKTCTDMVPAEPTTAVVAGQAIGPGTRISVRTTFRVPSWRECAAQGMTAPQAAAARGASPQAAYAAGKRQGLRWRSPGEARREAMRQATAARKGQRLAASVAAEERLVAAAERLASGDTATAIAEDEGVRTETLRRRLREVGLDPHRLRPTKSADRTIRAVLEEMPPRRAVELALDLIEELMGAGGGRVGHAVASGLQPGEAALLLRLDRSRGQAVTREALALAARPPRCLGEPPGPKVLDVRLVALRRKLAARWPWARIETVRGVGYRLVRDEAGRFPWEAADAARAA